MGDRNSKLVYSTHPEPLEESSTEEVPQKTEVLKMYLDKKNRAGKAVTVIEGFRENPDRLSEMARELKSLCACGGTSRFGVIEIQGDHRDKIQKKMNAMGYKVKRSGG